MIIYQTKKPVESLSTNCVGVTGDNLTHTQEFYIKGIYDSSLTYSLHLRFADGSVNTIIPDTVQHDGEGTGIRWVVKKNDIFMHGYFELQIEGRNDEGMVFQTEIIELYADESIPVEEKEYENPNSETLKLRDEAYELVQTLSQQQSKLEENAQLLDKYDLTKKLDDKEAVIKTKHLANYSVSSDKLEDGAVTNDKIEIGAVGEDELSTELQEKIDGKLDNTQEVIQTEHIASKAVTADKIADSAIITRKLANGCVLSNTIGKYQISAEHLISGCITADKLSEVLNNRIDNKANKTTTLLGYGITDAYTKNEVNNLLSTKLSSDVMQLIDSKYDASNVETGRGAFSILGANVDKINSASFEYHRNGDWVEVQIYVDFKAFTPINSSVSMTLSGLPYVCKNSVTPREMCVTTLKKQMLWGVVPNSAGLTLLLFSADAFAENEKLSYSIRYKIA